MRYQDGLKSLKFKKDTRYALVGPESYLKEQFVKASRAFNPNAEFSSFYPGEEEEALSLLYSKALFGERVIVLRRFERMNVKKFVDVIEKTDDFVIFVITDKAKLNTRAMTSVISKSCRVDCEKMREYGNGYQAWIISKVSDAGYSIKEGAEDTIYARTGPNMFSLAGEIKKLIFFKGKDKEISPSDVVKSVSLTASSTSFDILESLMKRDTARALACFESYSRIHGTFVELVAFLGAYMEKMYRMLLLREEKMPPDDIAGILGIPKFIVKIRYLPRALSLGKCGIAKEMDRLCVLDVALRKFSGSKKLLMENFIFGFAQ